MENSVQVFCDSQNAHHAPFICITGIRLGPVGVQNITLQREISMTLHLSFVHAASYLSAEWGRLVTASPPTSRPSSSSCAHQ